VNAGYSAAGLKGSCCNTYAGAAAGITTAADFPPRRPAGHIWYGTGLGTLRKCFAYQTPGPPGEPQRRNPMIIKSKDDTRAAVARLHALLVRKKNSKKQQAALEEELSRELAGAQAENEAAHHIDRALRDSKNWAVIHDLRLEHNGRVAQIDHLLIGRFFDIFVIGSQHVTTALRVDAAGEFHIRTGQSWKTIPSPIERNKRHIIVLNELIHHHQLMPTRLGLPMEPTFRNLIVVPSQCHISQRRVDEAIIVKIDSLDSRLAEFTGGSAPLGDILSVAKICSTQMIAEFARGLVGFHRPAASDYAARFGIDLPAPPVKSPAHADRQRCQECGATVGAKLAAFCRTNSRRFGKRILCRDCQAAVPAPSRRPITKNGRSSHRE